MVHDRAAPAADALLAKTKFDLALVDLMMPGEETGAAVRRLSAKGMPVIAMSSLSDTETGASVPARITILAKPFTFTALLQAVEESNLVRA